MFPGNTAHCLVNQPVPSQTDGLEQPGGKMLASKVEMKIKVVGITEMTALFRLGFLFKGCNLTIQPKFFNCF